METVAWFLGEPSLDLTRILEGCLWQVFGDKVWGAMEMQGIYCSNPGAG
jgi:hypothetical protein